MESMSYVSKYLNSSTVRAVAVLRALQSGTRPLSTRDISQNASVSYDQAYRILITLTAEGLVDRIDNRTWSLAGGVTVPPRSRRGKS